MIDSVLVPRGKGEKQPGEGGEIEHETIYLQGVRAPACRGDGVLFVERANELLLIAWLTPCDGGSRSESES